MILSDCLTVNCFLRRIPLIPCKKKSNSWLYIYIIYIYIQLITLNYLNFELLIFAFLNKKYRKFACFENLPEEPCLKSIKIGWKCNSNSFRRQEIKNPSIFSGIIIIQYDNLVTFLIIPKKVLLLLINKSYKCLAQIS